MQIEIGSITTIDGQLLRYVGDGKFEAVGPVQPVRPPAPAGELLVKRFEGGGPLSGQAVEGEQR